MLHSETYNVDGYHVERIVGRFSRVRWQCDCPTFHSPPPRWLYPWCRHVMSVMSQQQAPIHVAESSEEPRRQPDYCSGNDARGPAYSEVNLVSAGV